MFIFVLMFQQALHIFLAVLVYLSGIGFTINKHFCKGELVNAALFVKAEPCKNHKKQLSTEDFEKLGIDVSQLKACCIKALEEENGKDCCSDESEFLHHDQVIDHVDFRPFELQFVFQPHVTSHFSESFISHITHSNAQWSFLHFKPPFISVNTQELFQIYLI
jgi:hypothetical protein